MHKLRHLFIQGHPEIPDLDPLWDLFYESQIDQLLPVFALDVPIGFVVLLGQGHLLSGLFYENEIRENILRV